MQPVMNDMIEAELTKRWYDRRTDELVELYNSRRNHDQKKDTRIACWAASIIYVLFSILDAILISDVLAYTMIARFAVSIIGLAFVELQLALGRDSDAIDRTGAIMVIAAYAAWLAIASLSEQTINVSYYMIFGTIFMMVCNLFFNFSFRLSFFASTVVFACYLAAVSSIISVGIYYHAAVGMLYASSYMFTLYVNWKLNAERYRVFLNAVQAEIRQQEVVERGAALLRLSNTDALTGIANRRASDAELRRYWEDWQNGGRAFAVMLVDIDFFKRFNDQYGHQEGDRCLSLVADAMARLAESQACSVGRFGGEEFIFLARAEDKQAVATVAESIRRAVEALQIVHEQRPDGECVVTVSVGAAFSRDLAGAKVEKLVGEADRALYGAKANGRNYVRVFDRDHPQKNDDSENVAALLRTAISRDLISLVYQPIRSVHSGRMEAAEALMRLKMPDGKVISPAVFIPVAEQTGTIVELGKWAIRTACREMIVGGLAPTVSVNVSAVQLKSPGFSMSVAAIVGEMGIAPGRLAFEVTEGLEIESHPEVLRCIGELKQIGIKVWLDDFGTGFAGLSCLRAIDFDIVKIDRSFLHDSPTPKGAAMLQDIIRLIENRGHEMIVEGVENERQLNLLKLYGVDLLQGFHVGRPLPANAFRVHSGDEEPSTMTALSA